MLRRILIVVCVLLSSYSLARDLDIRVKNILDSNDFVYDTTDDGYFVVTFEIDSLRIQTVGITSETFTYENSEVREIISYAAEFENGIVPEELANNLLRQNYDKILGEWVVTENILAFSIEIDSDISPEKLLELIWLCAIVADGMEVQLGGNDVDNY